MNEINETESPLVERSRGEGEIPASQPLPFPTTCSEACWGSTVTIWKSLTFSIYIGHSVMFEFMLYYYFHFSSKILTLYFVPPTRSPTFEQLKHQGPQIGEWKSTLLMIFHRFAWPCRNCDWPCRKYSSLLGTHSSGWGHGCYLLIAIGGEHNLIVCLILLLKSVAISIGYGLRLWLRLSAERKVLPQSFTALLASLSSLYFACLLRASGTSSLEFKGHECLLPL